MVDVTGTKGRFWMISGAIARPLIARETGPADSPKPRLLDRVRAALRARHYSRRTEEAYVAWIRRYIFFHAKRHPAEMGAPEVTGFLTSLAVDGHVAASTQNQTLGSPENQSSLNLRRNRRGWLTGRWSGPATLAAQRRVRRTSRVRLSRGTNVYTLL